MDVFEKSTTEKTEIADFKQKLARMVKQFVHFTYIHMHSLQVQFAFHPCREQEFTF